LAARKSFSPFQANALHLFFTSLITFCFHLPYGSERDGEENSPHTHKPLLRINFGRKGWNDFFSLALGKSLGGDNQKTSVFKKIYNAIDIMRKYKSAVFFKTTLPQKI